MKTIRVTPRMAERMLIWLQQNGIEVLDDTETVADLVLAARQPMLDPTVEKGQTIQ